MSLIARATFSVILGLTLSTAHSEPKTNTARLDAVAERGRHVMPFDLEKTLHVFDKKTYGGIQQVIAKNADNQDQIKLIRQHLTELVSRFQQGDFSKQRRIHGDTMPGLAEMSADYKRIRFTYRELPNGAEIEYATEESALIDAIHRYFYAQLRDHARHAIGGNQTHCMHKTNTNRHKGHAAPKSKGKQE